VAAPVVAARATGRTTTTNTTSHAITMPSGIEAGDLLLVVFSTDGNPTCSATGWNKLGQDSNSTVVTGAVFWKVAAGSDTCTVTTTASEQSSHVSLRITGAGTPTGTAANGSSTNSNPPSHVSPRTGEDHLWIATRSGDSTVVATAAPSGYSDLQTLAAAGTGGASVNTAEKSTTADESDDPGTFTSASEQWVSWTVAVPPPDPPAISYVGAGTDSLVAGGTSNTPGLPAGLQDGDLMVLVYGGVSWSSTANAPGTPSGWTLKASTTASTPDSRLSWFYRRYQSGDSAPTLTYSGTSTDTHFAQIFAYRGALASGDPTDVLGTASENAAATDIGPISGVTTTASGGVVLVAGVREQDWSSVATLSGDSLTWVELADRADFALGDNIGVVVDHALTPAPTTVTSKTFTVTAGNTEVAIGQMWALLPATTGGDSDEVAADSATASDSSAVSATSAGTDSATASDSSALTAAAAPTDSGSVSESSGLGIGAAESVSTADSAALAADSSVSDAAALSELVSVALGGSDSGSVADSVALSVDLAASDAGAVDESVSAASDGSVSDSATVSEAADASVPSVDADSASATESAAVSASLTASDASLVTDSASVAVDLTVSEPFSASESGSVDGSTATEGSDSALLGEQAEVVAAAVVADSLALDESVLLSTGQIFRRLTGLATVSARLTGSATVSGRLSGSADQLTGSATVSGRATGSAGTSGRLTGSATTTGRLAGSVQTDRVAGSVDYL
jgi:hypothetical protein